MIEINTFSLTQIASGRMNRVVSQDVLNFRSFRNSMILTVKGKS